MIRTLARSFTIVLLFILTFSCTSQFESDLLLSTDGCDKPGISFKGDIVPLLERNCFNCHSDATYAIHGNSIDLDGYNDLFPYIESGRFLGAVNHEAEFEPMPQQGNKLSICSITKIETWIIEEYQNN